MDACATMPHDRDLYAPCPLLLRDTRTVLTVLERTTLARTVDLP